MGATSNDLLGLLDIALGIAKDKAFCDALAAVQAAQREYLIAEADANRAKARSIINSMVQIDITSRKLECEYRKIQGALTPDAQTHFKKLFDNLHAQHAALLQKKKNVGIESGNPQFPFEENINGTSLHPGDVLAASRKAGLYQHFAVYIGNQRVIHYAAENSDFSGRITIHEAPFSEFQGDSTFIYVLDFPDNSGHPSKRGTHFQSDPNEELLLFDLIRQTCYHLYTPTETIERAKSRLGEEKYALPFNNCEHFAIWCKTGVHESHQVNEWLSRIARFAIQYR